jgi:alkaline phosphatase D
MSPMIRCHRSEEKHSSITRRSGDDELERQRIYRSFRWGKAMELFLLDTRQYRDPNGRTMLGKTQKKWLLDKVSRSIALFKFIATSCPCLVAGVNVGTATLKKDRRS